MLTAEKKDNAMWVRPSGKITAAGVDEFRKELLELVEGGETELVIDLNDVDILDSKGIAVFIVCHKSLKEKGGDLSIVTDNEDFKGLFRVMRLDEHFTVRGSNE